MYSISILPAVSMTRPAASLQVNSSQAVSSHKCRTNAGRYKLHLGCMLTFELSIMHMVADRPSDAATVSVPYSCMGYDALLSQDAPEGSH